MFARPAAPTSSPPASTPNTSGHVLRPEAVHLLLQLQIPLPTSPFEGAPLPTDALSLPDLVLHLNDVHALSFWVLRAHTAELTRIDHEAEKRLSSSFTAAASLEDGNRVRAQKLLTACETLQYGKDLLDRQLGQLVVGPVLLSCLAFYVDATAYDMSALRRDVCALLAPGGGRARYCVDEDEEEEGCEQEEESEVLWGCVVDGGGSSGDDSSKKATNSNRAASSIAGTEAEDGVENSGGSGGQSFSSHCFFSAAAAAAVRSRWQRERARVASMPPPQSDIAVLLMSISNALYQSSAATTAVASDVTTASLPRALPLGIRGAPSENTAVAPDVALPLCPWLYPTMSHTACTLLHSSRVLSAMLRRGQSCLTHPLRPPLLFPTGAPAAPRHRHTTLGGGIRGQQGHRRMANDAHAGAHVTVTSPPFLPSQSAYARYCDGLRRRRGGVYRTTLVDEADGVVMGVARLTSQHRDGLSSSISGASQRTSSRRGRLVDPFASYACQSLQQQRQYVLLRCNLPPSRLSAQRPCEDEKTCRAGKAVHWSAVRPRSGSPVPPPPKQPKTTLACASGEDFNRAADVDVDDGRGLRLTRLLPLELQRRCLEYMTPRYLRTVSTVCAAWYRLVRCSPAHTALARAYRATTAVTRAYSVFFQQQWGEQALPVTHLTSLHRLRCVVAADDVGVTRLRRHWSAVRVDGEVCAHVRHCVSLTPLHHLCLVEDNEGREPPRNELQQNLAAAAAPPLSVALYVFYVLCVLPATPSFARSTSPLAVEQRHVHAALRRLLHAYAAALPRGDVWTAMATSHASPLLATEARRQQGLMWRLLTSPSSIALEADTADLLMQLWTHWTAVQEAWSYSQTHS